MERFTFWFNDKLYTDNSPASHSHHCAQATPSLPANFPDAVGDPSFDPVVGDTQERDTAMNLETETTKKAKAKVKAAPKAKARGASTSTKFSEYCRANKVDGVRARRALRAAGERAPYDPTSKKVQEVLKSL